ncbi:hypothetical protein QN362_11515 [Actimicrobium sp. CCC2.4]|nr:hypothetical protein [Actimicrobium sp. CCC2.4]MEB0135957.1 hypothetical protein [Actimicrobium sp. CCC2.4]WPX32621.1 hypothetical protein RHM62_01875 [Actimicrobium sp. CCC2.4]
MTGLSGIKKWCALLVCGVLTAAAHAAPDLAESTLQARYAQLAPRLADNQFKRPVVLDSIAAPNALKGDIYALVDHPFGEVNSLLNGPTRWCDVLILHLNTKYCRPTTDASGTILHVSVGKKTEQTLDESYQVDFVYRKGVHTPTYFDTRLDAKNGPLGTSNYRIVLEAVPVSGNKTFLHLTYSYAFGFTSKMAMQAYLATAGSDKVGFTIEGKQSDGQPDYIGGMRGVVERNTMRYYLAIAAYLNAPAADQIDIRLQAWFAATEDYPLQLHEVERRDYLAMKYHEIARQKAPQ